MGKVGSIRAPSSVAFSGAQFAPCVRPIAAAASPLMARKRAKNRAVRLLLLAAIALIAAGFLLRRSMLPRALEYLTTRPADLAADAQNVETGAAPAPTASDAQPGRVASPAGAPSLAAGPEAPPDEHLGARDRRALDDLLKSKSK